MKYYLDNPDNGRVGMCAVWMIVWVTLTPSVLGSVQLLMANIPLIKIQFCLLESLANNFVNFEQSCYETVGRVFNENNHSNIVHKISNNRYLKMEFSNHFIKLWTHGKIIHSLWKFIL